MVIYAKIRRMFYREHLTISDIQRRTSLSRNTIKKWLQEPSGSEPKYQRAKTIGKLTPFEPKLLLAPFNRIQECMISGSMRKMEETTLLVPEGEQTRIVYHADIVPGLWILRFAGQFFIENEARGQFGQIINEMIRRKQINNHQSMAN